MDWGREIVTRRGIGFDQGVIIKLDAFQTEECFDPCKGQPPMKLELAKKLCLLKLSWNGLIDKKDIVKYEYYDKSIFHRHSWAQNLSRVR